MISFLWYFAFIRGIGGYKLFSPRYICLAQDGGALQNPKKILVRIQAVLFRRLNEAVNHTAGLRTAGRVGEEPIFPPHHKWLYAGVRPGVKFCVSDIRQSQEWHWKAGRILA